MLQSIFLLTFLLAAAALSHNLQRHLQTDRNDACPPTGFSTKQNFEPTTYITKTWYSLKQLEVQFQEEDSFYCVRAQYTLDTKKNWWCRLFFMCDRLRIKVNNRGRIGSVDGPVDEANLYAFIKDSSEPSKLRVGPRILPPIINGPYWVLEAGTYAELLSGTNEFESTDYEWALISGGPPTIESNGKCTPGIPGPETRNGFWYFSSNPVPPEGVMEALDTLASETYGIDISLLRPVVQEGCTH